MAECLCSRGAVSFPANSGGTWEALGDELPGVGPKYYQHFGSLRRRQRWDVYGWGRVGSGLDRVPKRAGHWG